MLFINMLYNAIVILTNITLHIVMNITYYIILLIYIYIPTMTLVIIYKAIYSHPYA